MNVMSALPAEIITEFCKQCDWTYQTWLFRKTLFDNNPLAAELQKSNAGPALKLLSTVTHEYSMLQIMKLHDPEKNRRQYNLSIEYILNNGSWPGPLLSQLTELASRLCDFAEYLRQARHKILSHIDLDTILAHSTLGAFPKGRDTQYFEDLLIFANTIHKEVCGEPFVFDDLVTTDAKDFINMLKQGL